MKKQQLMLFFETLAGPLYAFTMALIPHPERALQLISDAGLAIFLAEKDSILSLMKRTPTTSDAQELKDWLMRAWLKKIFCLANARATTNDILGKGPFYSANMVERAALYLRHRQHCSYAEMEDILNLPRHELHAALARGQLVVGENQ